MKFDDRNEWGHYRKRIQNDARPDFGIQSMHGDRVLSTVRGGGSGRAWIYCIADFGSEADLFVRLFVSLQLHVRSETTVGVQHPPAAGTICGQNLIGLSEPPAPPPKLQYDILLTLCSRFSRYYRHLKTRKNVTYNNNTILT